MSSVIATTPSGQRLPFGALLAATAVSIIGNFMTLVALPWFVLEITGSVAKTGAVAVAITLPQMLAGFFANTVVDRLGYVRASVLSDLAAGGTVALIPLLYHTVGLAFWQILLIVFCGNLLGTAGNTGRQSLLPDVIALARLPRSRANSWYQSVFNFAFLAGPLIAGLAIPVIGTSNVLWLDAATFAFSALVVGLCVCQTATRTARATEPYLTQLREGFHFIAHDRPLLAVFGFSVAIGLIGPSFFNLLLPLYARERYGVALALGLMRSGWAAGLLLGTLAYGVLGERLSRRATYLLACAVGVGPFSLLILGPPLAVSVGALFVASVALGPLNPLRLTIQQERTPEVLRSRVFGTGNALLFAAAPAGTVLFSAIAERGGISVAIAVTSIVWFGILIAVWLIPAFGQLEAPIVPVEMKGASSEEGTMTVGLQPSTD